MIMKYNRQKLLKKIDDFFLGAISKMDLGTWANRAYYDLLRGGYIEIEKIVIYPFVKVISTFHLRENDKDDFHPCTEEKVKLIRDILSGKRNFEFAVVMSIPPQIYSVINEEYPYYKEKQEFFNKLRESAICYSEQIKMFCDEMELITCSKNENKIIPDLLEERIIRYIKILVKKDMDELELHKKMKLYAQKTEKNTFAERLDNYLECYIGNKNFQLFITYENGETDIFIDV